MTTFEPGMKGFSEPIPRKGTETHASNEVMLNNPPGFSEPIPRKGTETALVNSGAEKVELIVFQNLFPARGRKLLLHSQGCHPSLYSFSEPIPRKGTETLVGSRVFVHHTLEFFRTYSPQGDGND